MASNLVIGANGYIGRHLVHYLIESGEAVTPCGTGLESIDKIPNYVSLDISNKEQVEKFDFDFDFVFMFAGITGTKAGFDNYEQYIEVNVMGLLNILDQIKNSASTAKIIFPSTRLVFKGQKDRFLDEDATKEAKTIYAQNKLSCEAYLAMYANFYKIDFTIYRLCVVYGNIFDSKYSYGTIGFFLGRALKGEDIVLFGRGEPKRTFTHVEDICKMILQSYKLPSSSHNTFNVGGEDNLDLKDAAEIIASRYNVGVDFIDWPEEEENLESGDTIFDDSKIQKLLDYSYIHNLEDWLKTT